MPLGQPSISTPRSLQLQAVQQSIDNIRERFTAAEAVILALQSSAAGAVQASASNLAALRRQLAQLDARVTALEQSAPGGGTGPVEVLQAASVLDVGYPVWLSADGTVSALDPDDPLAAAGFYGLSTQAGAVGDDVQIRRSGILEIPGATFTTGRQLYAAADGVTHEPVGNALPVGIAVSATAVSVTPGTLALAMLSTGLLGADFLPVTFALAAAAIALAEQFDLDGTPGPADGWVLTYDAATMKYRPRPPTGGISGGYFGSAYFGPGYFGGRYFGKGDV